jgi:hypothetical protein
MYFCTSVYFKTSGKKTPTNSDKKSNPALNNWSQKTEQSSDDSGHFIFKFFSNLIENVYRERFGFAQNNLHIERFSPSKKL